MKTWKFVIKQKKGSRIEGELISPRGTKWKAVSGGYGKGALPGGFYVIGSGWKISKNKPNFRPMHDAHGNSWQVQISDRAGRSRLYIHPDAPPKGTEGCIGVDFKTNTASLFSQLISAKNQLLYVDIHGSSSDLKSA